MWWKRKKEKYPVLVLERDRLEWKYYKVPPRDLGPSWLYRGRTIWVARRNGKNLKPFALPEHDPKKVTSTELYANLEQEEIRELFKPVSTLLEKIQLGLFVVLALGLGFLCYIMWTTVIGR